MKLRIALSVPAPSPVEEGSIRESPESSSCVHCAKLFFPTPVGTPGGKPLRLTARVKIARARPDRFWPAEPFFCVSVCPSVYPVCRPKFGSAKVRALWHSSLFSNRLNHECPSLLVVSHRASRSRKNRLVVESPLIEDVFVWCTLFLRMYIHRVSSRHWPSAPLTQDAARIAQGL